MDFYSLLILNLMMVVIDELKIKVARSHSY